MKEVIKKNNLSKFAGKLNCSEADKMLSSIREDKN